MELDLDCWDGVSLDTVMSSLKKLRWDRVAGTEEEVREFLESSLRADGLPVLREKQLSVGGRIDLLIGSIGIEIKRDRPTPSSIVRQVSRYAAAPELRAIIVVAERRCSIPDAINGKPIRMLGLFSLWGIR